MFTKECLQCSEEYTCKAREQKYCSVECFRASRCPVTDELNQEKAQDTTLRMDALPPPEELPAPYAKRVYDMWLSLISNSKTTTRIA